MAGYRIDRISEDIKREIVAVMRELKDPRVQTLISITRVDTTPDLRYSKIYVSVLEEARSQDAIRGLKSAAGCSCATRRSCNSSWTIPSPTARIFWIFCTT